MVQTDMFPESNSNYRYRIVPPELMSITETDLWECWQKSLTTDTDSPLNFERNSTADTDFGLETNSFGKNSATTVLPQEWPDCL